MLPAVGLVAIAVALYGGSTGSDFVFDDHLLVAGDRPIQETFDLARIFGRERVAGRYRPVRRLTFALDFKAWGPAPSGFHLTNVILHGINAWLVFALIRRFVGTGGAWWAALLFLCHPVQSEAVLRISGRGDLLVVLFGLLAVLALLRCGGSRRGDAVLVAAALALGAGAALSKDTGFAVPFACLPIVAFASRRFGRAGVWRGGLVFVGAALVAGFAAVCLSGVPGTGRFWGGGLARTSFLAADVFARYARLFVWPTKLRAVHWPATPDSAFEPRVMLGAIAAIGIGLAICATRRRQPLIAAGLGWCLIALAPVLNFIPFERKMAEHFLYLPMVGIACASAGSFTGRNGSRLIPCGLVAVAFSALGLGRVTTWGTDLTLWRDTMRKSPHAAVVHMNLGNAYARQGEHERAVACYEHAAERSPSWGRIHSQMASAYRALGRHSDAAVAFEKAIACGLRNGKLLNSLALAHQRSGSTRKALTAFEQAVTVDPDYAVARYNFGNLLLDLGQTVRAVQQLRAAVELDPAYAEAWQNLGSAYATLRRTDGAAACCEKALRLKPTLWQAHLLLALLDHSGGQTQKAIARLAEAVRICPNAAELRAALDQMRQGRSSREQSTQSPTEK